MSLAVYFLIFAVAYGAAGRFAGSGINVPGRQVWWAALALALLTVVVAFFGHQGDAWGALLAFPWMIGRDLKPAIFGGSTTPVKGREISGTFERDLLWAMFGLISCVVFRIWRRPDGSPLIALALGAGFLAFAVYATALSVWAGKENSAPKPRNITWIVECLQSPVYGLLVALAMI